MSKDFNPWWKKVNDYLVLEELKEFQRGAGGYRPNNRQEAMMGLLTSGYVNKTFAKVDSFKGKKQSEA